jgi:signal transduction histidine kinase
MTTMMVGSVTTFFGFRSHIAHEHEEIKTTSEIVYRVLAKHYEIFYKENFKVMIDSLTAEKNALSDLKTIDFGKRSIAVLTEEGKILLHRHNGMVGMNVTQLKTKTGEILINKERLASIFETSKLTNGSFISYQWTNDVGNQIEKEAYVRAFEPWKWIIVANYDLSELKQRTIFLEMTGWLISAILNFFVIFISMNMVCSRKTGLTYDI